MPNRILREGILTSPRIAKLGWAEEVFYRRLHSVVDDFGRYFADPGMLRAACYPRQLNKVSDSDVGKWLHGCVAAALVSIYQVEGEDYLLLLDFGQQVRAKKSKFPDPLSKCVADAEQPPANAHLDVSVSVFVSEDDKAPRKRFATPDGVSSAIWDDYLDTRKAKMTETALKGLRREAAKAGMSLEEALSTSCERGWRGFRAEWVMKRGDVARSTVPSSTTPDPELARLKAHKGSAPSPETRERMAKLRQGAH